MDNKNIFQIYAMTPIQNVWLTIFNFGPAILLGIYKHWWLGVLALATTFILSWVLFFAVTPRIPINAVNAWAWLKPVVIAGVVLSIGWWGF